MLRVSRRISERNAQWSVRRLVCVRMYLYGARMTADTVLVRRPTAIPAGEVRAPVFELGRPIAGVNVGIRTDGAWRSWRLIANVWDEYLRRDGATTSLVETGAMVGQTGANDRKHIEELANGVECAIVGLGTCGSCTTFTIKDSVVVEGKQKPVVAIVTEEFEVHGHNVATHLGTVTSSCSCCRTRSRRAPRTSCARSPTSTTRR